MKSHLLRIDLIVMDESLADAYILHISRMCARAGLDLALAEGQSFPPFSFIAGQICSPRLRGQSDACDIPA